MSELDDVLGIDTVLDGDGLPNPEDQKEIERFNERRQRIDDVRAGIEIARGLSNKDWATTLLKNSADNLTIAQNITTHELEDNPKASNITALAEVSNALKETVNSVLDMDKSKRHLDIMQEKNDLRRIEIQQREGPVLDAGDDIKAVATGRDILKLIKSGVELT